MNPSPSCDPPPPPPGEEAQRVPPRPRLHVRLHRLQHHVRHPGNNYDFDYDDYVSTPCPAPRRSSSTRPPTRTAEASSRDSVSVQTKLNFISVSSFYCFQTFHHKLFQGNGFIASAVIYGVFSIASWLAPSVVAWKGPRLDCSRKVLKS